MLTQPLLQQLHELRLRGMAAAFEQQLTTLASNDLNFEERLGLLIQHELIERQSCRLRQRLRWAKFTQTAALEDLDLKAARGIDRAALGQVTDLGWIRERLNVIVTGPTGVGKSFLACAVGHAACRADLDAQTKNGYHHQNDKRSLTKTVVSTKVLTSCLNRPGMPWTRGPTSGGNTGRHAWNQHSGIAEPTSADAARWLHTSFNEPFGHERTERYFQDIYDQRIMTLHPVSRLGISLYAPLFHDDYTLLRRSIPAVFAYILTGHHSDEYLAAIARWGKKPETGA
jgi:hypothetical protein